MTDLIAIEYNLPGDPKKYVMYIKGDVALEEKPITPLGGVKKERKVLNYIMELDLKTLEFHCA